MGTDVTPNPDDVRSSKCFACYVPVVARILMGLIFFVFGLNGCLNFIQKPPTIAEGVRARVVNSSDPSDAPFVNEVLQDYHLSSVCAASCNFGDGWRGFAQEYGAAGGARKAGATHP